MVFRYRRTLLVIAVIVGWLVVRHHVLRMDERWFEPSLAGVKGFVLYELGQYTGAAAAYRAHLRSTADQWHFGDPAFEALLRGDLDASEELSRRAFVEDPEAHSAALNLAEIALERGETDRALERVTAALTRSPDDVDGWLLSAVINARLGKHDRAVDAFHRALRTGGVETRPTVFLWVLRTAGELLEQPSQTTPWCVLAQAFRYLRIYDPANARPAIRYARRAIAVGDRPSDAYVAIGVVERKRGRSARALEAFLRSVEIDPKNAEASRWAATIYSEQGDLVREYRMSKTAFEAATHDPFYVRPLNYVLVEKLGDVRQATDLFERAVVVHPDNVRLHDRLGYLYGFVGDHQRSRASYLRAIELEPANPILYEALAFSLARLDLAHEALAAYERAAALDLNRHEPHTGIAHLYYDLHQYDRALEEYRLAFKLGEDDIDEHAQLCALYHVISQFDQAAICLKMVLARDPRHTLAQRLWAETERNRRAVRQAVTE